MMPGKIYVATESYHATIKGVPYTVHANRTRVREGHVLIRQNPEFYREATDLVDYDVEEATAEPPRARRASVKAAD